MDVGAGGYEKRVKATREVHVRVGALACGALGALWLLVGCGSSNARNSGSNDFTDYEPKLLEEPLAVHRSRTRLARYGTYTVAYHIDWRQPQWVAYRLDAMRLAEVVDRRGVGFHSDPLLKNYTLDGANFKGTGYSRGHLKPAADSRSSRTAMQECFYYSNVSPQLPGFNSGSWNRLEMWVRRCAGKTDMLYVATGPCFLGTSRGRMGSTGVPVATHFYKALLRRDGDAWRAVGFVLPHSESRLDGLWQCAVSIDSLERLTEIDFFPLLADSVERVVEANFDRNAWR